MTNQRSQIKFINHQKKHKIDILWLKKRLFPILGKKGYAEIVFVNDRTISKLNKEYLGKKSSTDVLSFNLGSKNKIEGEIVISIDTAKRQAKKRNISLENELLLLCIHGLLHLVGEEDYDERSSLLMKQKEIKFLFKSMENV